MTRPAHSQSPAAAPMGRIAGTGSFRSVRPRHYARGLSPLMVRIMAVNVIALLVGLVGYLYLGAFRADLIAARVDALQVQAEIIAGALGESAAGGPESTDVDVAAARPILRRLVGPTDLRARLYGSEGGLVLDSRFMEGAARVVVEPLPPPGQTVPVSERLEGLMHRLLDRIMPRPPAEPMPAEPVLRVEQLLELSTSFAGERAVAIRRDSGGLHMINVAVPVQRFRRVLGALLITGETGDIERIVRAEQVRVLAIFAGALAITLLLSFFLGRTVVSPVRKLARAAERVRRNAGRQEDLPEFAERGDEIGDLSRSLADMTRALYNQIDAVERFAADVAHELKNPLTSMRSALETLERTDNPAVQRRLMEILIDDVRRLDRLIGDVSDASRLDADLTRGTSQMLDLDRHLADLVAAYGAVDRPRATVRYDGPGTPVMVAALERRLSQVWRNLVDNAISFSEADGVVRLTLLPERRQVRVLVDDDGPGLPEGAEGRIFKRFYSERPDSQGFGNHSGLGLAISRQIVEAHGGRLTAMNRLGDQGGVVGARFEVILPRPANRSGDGS
ncbi:stimulus-sensing domain-containing protein [Yunchengibacter salinarum]|uniref:stimulus-sensing domain-containing protein n=1 Tax=Yunchengibacter salinarum TaxID=3133399 RepID=UPI0035B68C6A